MKKYLIRADFDPRIKPDPTDYVGKNFVGGNSGNLMFAYGVMNVLSTENTQTDYTYKWQFSDEEADRINQTYDAFILPMADAFRAGFVRQLEGYTGLVKRLRIPVVVAGIGLRADYDPDFKKGFEFDGAAAAFVKAVLDRSPILGLRGEITADYLKHLGFIPEKDFTPIGCPSLYTYGDSVRTRDIPPAVTHLAVNTNGYYNIGHINEFLLKTVHQIPDYVLIQQLQDEYHDLFIGKGFLPFLLSGKAGAQDKYIIKGDALKNLYRQDRVRFFFDVPSWINFVRPFDMFIGNRFHGSVAAVLAGTPHVMIPFNARTRELTEFHHLTSLTPDDIRENTSISDYLDQLDFHSFEKHQTANLLHYIDFLDKTGLEHIFREKHGWEMGESLMEKRIAGALGTPVGEQMYIAHDYLSLPFAGRARRAALCHYKALRRKVMKH